MFKRLAGIIIIVIFVTIMIGNVIEKNGKEEITGPADELKYDNELTTKGGLISSAGEAGIEVGNPAPRFELTLLDGNKMDLADLQGKKVILNFWTTWCTYCLEELPVLQKYYQDNQDQVEIVGINITASEKNVNAVETFIANNKYTFPILLDTEMTVSKLYQVMAIPTTYFIGSDGVIQAPRKVGPMSYDFIEDAMEKLN